MAEGDPRFHALLEDMRQLHVRKAVDYGDEDPLANLRAAEEFGIPNWVGCCLRLNDKVKRLKSMAKKGRLVNESLEDSLLDIANYALLALILYRETRPVVAPVPFEVPALPPAFPVPAALVSGPGEDEKDCRFVSGRVVGHPVEAPALLATFGLMSGSIDSGLVAVVPAVPREPLRTIYAGSIHVSGPLLNTLLMGVPGSGTVGRAEVLCCGVSMGSMVEKDRAGEGGRKGGWEPGDNKGERSDDLRATDR